LRLSVIPAIQDAAARLSRDQRAIIIATVRSMAFGQYCFTDYQAV
jgi:hypothetical protein